MACDRLIMPALTNPMTIMSVAEELCTSIVTTMPMSTPAGRLPVTRSTRFASSSV